MEFDPRTRRASTGAAATQSAPEPGKRTLTAELVPRDAAEPSSPRPTGAGPAVPAADVGGARPSLQMLFGARTTGDPAAGATQQPQVAPVQRMVGEHTAPAASEPGPSAAPTDRVEIPALLHFIWMGKPPTDGAVHNILAWAARAKNTSWHILLWTDDAIQTGKWAPQLAALSGSVEVRQIRPIIDPRLRAHYLDAIEKTPRAFNVASDLARYSILHQLGGVYADVDLGPGDVDLTRVPKLSASDIPVTAPSVRDRQALDEQLRPEELEILSTREAAQVAAQRAYRKNQLNNNLMISGPHSAFMNKLIDNADHRVSAKQDEREEWADTAALITGPQAMIRTMYQHVGVSERPLIESMDRDTLGHWSRLDWLTEESEHQSYDTGAARGGASHTGAGKTDRRCFLTTACVEARGLPDDCYELTTLRAFRDGYLRRLPDGEAMIREYYDIAPKIVAALQRDPRFHERADDLYERLVLGAIRLIEAGKEHDALAHYRAIVNELRAAPGQ